MTELRDDDRLRERFLELRGEMAERGRVPDFEAVLQRARTEATARPSLDLIDGRASSGTTGARPHRRLVRAGAWASAALAATVAGLLLTDRRPRSDDEFARIVAAYSSDFSGGAWRSPTSALLDVPGMELVRSLPSIGAPVRGLDPATLPAREPATQEENL